MENVEFIIGDSGITLPILLDELSSQSMPVELILIDGDHTKEGVERDINSILKYKPITPLIVIMHDSFNPECREGMINANWESSEHVQYIDLDFIPGRIIENGSQSDGEMWGGLGLFYMTPEVRKGSITPMKTAEKFYNKMLS